MASVRWVLCFYAVVFWQPCAVACRNIFAMHFYAVVISKKIISEAALLPVGFAID